MSPAVWDDDAALLNTGNGVLHRQPAWESCNTDAIPVANRHVAIDAAAGRRELAYKRDCRRCFRADGAG